METDEDDDNSLVAANEQWGLFDAVDNPLSDSKIKKMVLLWLPDEEPSEFLLAACEKLNKDSPDWPGTTISFQSTPSAGFYIEISRDWWLNSSSQKDEFFRKFIWEIERAKVNI